MIYVEYLFFPIYSYSLSGVEFKGKYSLNASKNLILRVKVKENSKKNASAKFSYFHLKKIVVVKNI